MESVGIKELKAHLSQYLGKVRTGQVILITDRGEAVAELHPLSSEREAVRALAERGRVRWSGGKPKGLAGVCAEGTSVSEIVIEDRR
ncbi:MAG: type II toxin-antitoxin system prevent-host-death family antitoxin [Deltaproteobacteria bacterium]|nr:type II toxin-antitoxin system prevent-host-death family antitoxin [Deltaproteobacteria bacterium]